MEYIFYINGELFYKTDNPTNKFIVESVLVKQNIQYQLFEEAA